MSCDNIINFQKKMVLIRSFEKTLLDLFAAGKLSGTTHTYQGQEAIAVAALDYVGEQDGVFSNHRCHGHYIAYGGDVQALLSEIMGLEHGVCGGRGGSQHLHWKNFFTNGIQGGMLPCAAGYAYAARLRGEEAIAVAFIGDGTLGEGIVYETLNMVSLWNIPLLIVVEDNGYAQTTPRVKNCAGEIANRFSAFGVQTTECTSNDVLELHEMFGKAFSYVRECKKPCCCIVHTYRLGPHSKGDDFRDPAEIAAWRKKDPLLINGARLKTEENAEIEKEVQSFLEQCVNNARRGDRERVEHVHTGISDFYTASGRKDAPPITARYFESLNTTLHHLLAEHSTALVIGEDILDPYGGSFKVTKGLSTDYPDQVISTPISEAGFSGIANGLALNGMHPIVEIMFADFSTLIFDQVLNHGAKFKWMYNDQVSVPVIYRLPTGGKRGYGATHSQCLEKIFFGLPNITVVAPSHFHDPGQLLCDIYDNADTPVIFVENKGLYTEILAIEQDGKMNNYFCERSDKLFPTLRLCPDCTEPEYSIICYGGGLKTALQAAWDIMMEEEINVEIICPSLISPVPEDDLLCFLSDSSRKVLVLDESYSDFGWSSEIARRIERHDRKNNRQRSVMLAGSEYVYISANKDVEIETSVTAEKVKSALLGGET